MTSIDFGRTERNAERLVWFTVEELQEEVNRRTRLPSQKPEPLENPNFEYLVQACQRYLEALGTDDQRDDDNYIFAKAMEAVYGKTVWKWVNEVKR